MITLRTKIIMKAYQKIMTVVRVDAAYCSNRDYPLQTEDRHRRARGPVHVI